MAKVVVQYAVLTNFTRQYGQPLASDLHGVTTVRHIPGYLEFPRDGGRLELFVRFFATDLPPSKVRVTVDWEGSMYTRRVYRAVGDINLRPTTGTVVLDRTYKFVGLSLVGEGTYTIRVWGPDFSYRRRQWRCLAREYFWVERSP